MLFKLVESSKTIGFLFGMWTIFLRKTLTCRIFVSSAPLDLLVSWRARTSAMTGNHHVSEIQDFHFWNSKMLFLKGWSLKAVHFLGILGIQPSQNLAEWFGWLRLSRKILENHFCDVLKLNVTNPGSLLRIPKNHVSTSRAYIVFWVLKTLLEFLINSY